MSDHARENDLASVRRDQAAAENQTLPSAPPSSAERLDCLRKFREASSGAVRCCTEVVHHRSLDDGLRPCADRAFPDSSCCTTLVHNREKPSPTRSSPSVRSSRSAGGLTLRGRVFYVRLRVPRSLQRTVGRTHFYMA
jgi:hypothetical protein